MAKLHDGNILISTSAYTEVELVIKLKARDEQAFSFLYDRYAQALFGIICQIVTPEETAEDVLQQTFLKIWKGINQYDASKGRLFTWMLNIARHQAIDHTRSTAFNNQGKTIPLTENVYEKDGGSPADPRDYGLKKLLEKLAPENRRLLELFYFFGYTHNEIAGFLKMPLGTVKTRLRSTILELRKYLDIKSK